MKFLDKAKIRVISGHGGNGMGGSEEQQKMVEQLSLEIDRQQFVSKYIESITIEKTKDTASGLIIKEVKLGRSSFIFYCSNRKT